MVCVSWLLMAVMAYVCIPGFGSVCWDGTICDDLSNKERLLVGPSSLLFSLRFIVAGCVKSSRIGVTPLAHINVHLCMSVLQAELSSLALSKPNLEARKGERRSYSMEHFRWGKPTGRKRRPVKAFASSLEGGGPFDGGVPPPARRQLSSTEDRAKDDLNAESHQTRGLPTAMVTPKSQVLLSPQERKDGTYRMSHFRWGSPRASKRNGSLMKPWEVKPQGLLAKLLKNTFLNEEHQRKMG